MAIVRCKSGDCGTPTKATIAGLPAAPVGANVVYQCTPSAKNPCPPPGKPCGCYVVATEHHSTTGLATGTEEQGDQVTYGSTPDMTQATVADQYGAMLTVADQAAKYPPGSWPTGTGKVTPWWTITCMCLETKGGKPLVALSVTVPVDQYASVLHELGERFGEENVGILQNDMTGNKS